VTDRTTIDREGWLEQRKTAIGASESAALLGVNPWMGTFELWCVKTGRLVPEFTPEQEERMAWGTRLEGIVMEAFELEADPWPQDQIVRHPSGLPMSCTPDGIVVGRPEGVEVKTSGARPWDEPPLHYQVQCQHQMACHPEWRSVHLVALFRGQQLRSWRIDRNDRFIAALEARCTDWWEEHIVGDTPPSGDVSTSAIQCLARLHPDDNGEEVELPAESVEWDRLLGVIKGDMAALKTEKEETENRIKAAIGAATYGTLPGGKGRYSWKTTERTGGAKFRVLRRGR